MYHFYWGLRAQSTNLDFFFIFSEESNRTYCHACPKSFSRASEYYIHAEKYHFESIGDIWLKCCDCTRYFPTKGALKNHQVSKLHGDFNSDEPKPKKKRVRPSRRKVVVPKSPPSQVAVTCVFCNEDFKTNAVFVAHVNQDHVDQVSDMWIPCDSCNFYCPDNKALKVHSLGFIGHSNCLICIVNV